MTLQRTEPLALSTSTLMGDKVLNFQNEEIGKLEEIMIDIHTGRIAYAVISFGGLLGIGNKLFAVPWSALRVDTDRECVVMDADKERLKNAPGFDKNDWPETPNGEWYHEVYKYYDQQPYWQQK
ncbi:MAG: PRC-barrel domain containing protein [Chloroflexi bacterium]|nr:PRC-barrel domain containing protein [Chloroflexota bacterium]